MMKFLSVLMIFFALPLSAQLPGRFEIFVSTPVTDAQGQPLPGTLPTADQFGFTVVAGCRVEILDAGADGVANPPAADGRPGGDDTILHTASIGEGMSPNQLQSGRFSVSFAPSPAQGTNVYVRVFDAPTVAGSAHWGQSSVGTVAGSRMDVGALGLWGTTQTAGVDSTVTDSDNDGMSDWEEAVAGTSALSAADRARIVSATDGQLTLSVKTGRTYVIYRSFSALGDTMHWTPVLTLPAQAAAGDISVTLPAAPADTVQVFYRYEVH